MKKHFLTIAILFATIIAFAQSGKKPPAKEKPPTQKEMADMMKEMQEALNEMSPEDKKVMDSMGIKMPSLNNVPKMSDKQLADAWEDESRVVLKRDASRIAAIPKTITDAKMGAYITAIQNKLVSTFKPVVVSMGNNVYDYIKSNNKNSGEAANMAIGLWLAGQPELALYVLGKLCAIDAGNTDNISNYSAMLSMQGAQHLAIPILNNLNAKYPKNSTLLNNLGQAWFGLGEIGKAEKYLDSTIRIYAYHPQANLTKAAIEESRGNTSKAIEALKKSIKHNYTNEKEEKLSKHGYKLTLADVRLPFKPSADPLGLGRFRQPDYPKSVSDLKVLIPQWEAFDADCDKEIAKLKNELAEAAVKYEQNLKATMAQSLQVINSGGTIPASAQKPLYATKASLAMQDVISNNEVKLERMGEKLLILGTNLDQLQKTRKKAAPEAPCEAHVKAEDEFLNQYNGLKQAYNNEALKVFKHFGNDMAYWAQYTSTDEVQFEILKLTGKINWLEKLKEYRPLLTAGGREFSECVEKKDGKSGKLAEFDDIACQYKSIVNFGCVKLETNCSHTTTTYGCGMVSVAEKELGQNYIGATVKLSPKTSIGGNVGPLTVEASIGADITIELNENNHVKEWGGKVTTGVEAGVGINKGPVKAGATVSEALEVEIGSNGIGDVNIVTTAKIEVGIEAPKSAGNNRIDEQINQGVEYVNKGLGKLNTKVEIGVEDRVSLISGHGSVSGTGILSGVKISEW